MLVRRRVTGHSGGGRQGAAIRGRTSSGVLSSRSYNLQAKSPGNKCAARALFQMMDASNPSRVTTMTRDIGKSGKSPPGSSEKEDQIDANMRRMFEDDAKKDLPSELQRLLDRLDEVPIPKEFGRIPDQDE